MSRDDETSVAREWIAAVLMGRAGASPFPSGQRVGAVVRVAAAEGVAALVHARLQEPVAGVPESLLRALQPIAQERAMQSLHRVAQCRLVLGQLADEGISALVLKGVALAHWAYAAPYLRECGDVDLLLPSHGDVERAAGLVAPLGYVPGSTAPARDCVSFETCCVHAGADRLELDLHWRFANAALFATRLDWGELWARAQPLPALAATARGFGPAHALLHACVRRVQSPWFSAPNRLRVLYDFVAIAGKLQADDWRDFAELAEARELAGVCRDDLRTAEARFGSFVPDRVMDALAAAAAREPVQADRLGDWLYFQRATWRSLPSVRMRVRWLRQLLLPGRAHLLERHGARGGLPGALWRRLCEGAGRAAR